LSAGLTVNELPTSSTVLPSGGEFIATMVPITVPPPGRFSTTTVFPVVRPMWSPRSREMMSGPLPGV